MKRWRKFALVFAVVLAIGQTPVTTTACGHGSHHSTTRYKVCSIRSCKKTKTHKHHGKTYLPHSVNDGHSYHRSHH